MLSRWFFNAWKMGKLSFDIFPLIHRNFLIFCLTYSPFLIILALGFILPLKLKSFKKVFIFVRFGNFFKLLFIYIYWYICFWIISIFWFGIDNIRNCFTHLIPLWISFNLFLVKYLNLFQTCQLAFSTRWTNEKLFNFIKQRRLFFFLLRLFLDKHLIDLPKSILMYFLPKNSILYFKKSANALSYW